MSALVCPVIVGRESELAAVDQTLRGAASGKGGAIFVLGEAGIGKTRLADETRDRAVALGMPVLRGRAIEGGSQVPFRPFAEAFQGAFRKEGRFPAELAPFSPVLGKVVPQWAQDKSLPETNPVLLFEAIVRILGLLGEEAGALLTLEDLHWADAETLSAVEYLVDQLPAVGVACLVTGRTEEPLESARMLSRIAARVPGSRFLLERLRQPLIEEMAREILGDAPASSEIVSAVAKRSEGVPLLVEELLSAYVGSAHELLEDAKLQELPVSYALVIEQRLALLNQEEREVAVAAAAVGDFRPDLLGCHGAARAQSARRAAVVLAREPPHRTGGRQFAHARLQTCDGR